MQITRRSVKLTVSAGLFAALALSALAQNMMGAYQSPVQSIVATSVGLTSPNGDIVVTISDAASVLSYSATYRGAVILETSPLGVTVNGTSLGAGVVIGGSSAYSTNETFVSRSGIHALATNQYSGNKVSLTHAASGLSYFLNVRVYNNGVAFRYEFTNASTKNITAETSSFVIPANSTVWADTNTSNYEKYYVPNTITAWPTNIGMGPPVTIQLSGNIGYLALTESTLGVFGNPFIIKVPDATGRQLQVGYPKNQGGSTGASVTGPVNTPWNVVMVGPDLNMIVNNDIVESLAPAPDPALFPEGTVTSWATMGRSVWDYLRPLPGGITWTNAMTNSLWASRMGFEYNTIDEGWANWMNSSAAVDPWPLVQQVVNYSHSLGVKVMLWKTSSALNTQSQRTAFFQQLHAYGVDGFKADFFDYSSVNCAARERVQLQEAILREAAPYHLVANFHGSAKPTGQYRTYPNLIGVEAVFGKEQWPNPWMVVTLPFMRFLAGPADFTPLEFGGNAAFEVAHLINMPGPLITFAERSDKIASSAFASLIRTIPCQWDETIILSQSLLGQTTASARRTGQDWYIGIMNAKATNAWNLPLTFLASNITYQADIIRQDSTVLERRTVTRDTILSVSITSTNGSGFVAKFYQVPPFTVPASYRLIGTIIGTSGSWGSSGNTRDKVFDGNLTTYFDSPNNNGDWVGLDFGASNQKIVSILRYCPRANWASRMVPGVFQGANLADFSDAVTLWTVGYVPPEGAFTTIALTNQTAYRYVRYLSPNGGNCNVAEIQFYGAAVPTAPTSLTAMPGINQLALNWDVSSNSMGYNLKRASTSGGPYTIIATNLVSTSFVDNGLLDGVAYYYVVSAQTMGLESPDSVETQAAPISPYDVTLNFVWNGETLILSWAGGGKLLESADLSGAWTTNDSAISPFTVAPASSSRFYKVRVQ